LALTGPGRAAGDSHYEKMAGCFWQVRLTIRLPLVGIVHSADYRSGAATLCLTATGLLMEDTIPKPGGLGSGGPRGTRFIGSAFTEYSMNIRRLSNACSMMLQRKYGR
jgi:hypothetical protein